MTKLRRSVLAMLLTALPLMAAAPASSQAHAPSGAVFALIDQNEWCPGGSVYLDLRTGAFMLFPRAARPGCSDSNVARAVQRGMLNQAALQRLRAASADARRAGLRRETCDLVVSNGGPEAVVTTAPGFSEAAPEERGCWSAQAVALHRTLADVFGKGAPPAR
jgi:hypothetical protein